MNPQEFHIVFKSYLRDENVDATCNTPKKTLNKLSENQFEELATDIQDEVKRRTSPENIFFLQVRADYHPKRNQARQKLATLPDKRFKSLAIDVMIELEQRFMNENTPNQVPVDVEQISQADVQKTELVTIPSEVISDPLALLVKDIISLVNDKLVLKSSNTLTFNFEKKCAILDQELTEEKIKNLELEKQLKEAKAKIDSLTTQLDNAALYLSRVKLVLQSAE